MNSFFEEHETKIDESNKWNSTPIIQSSNQLMFKEGHRHTVWQNDCLLQIRHLVCLLLFCTSIDR